MSPFNEINLAASKPLPTQYPVKLKTIGDHLRRRRLELGLEQKVVAKALNVSAATILNWELGHTSPPTHKGKQIIGFLRYNPQPRPTTFRQEMLAYRWENGLRSSEAAKVIKIDSASWSSWERGEHRPTQKSLQKMRCIGIGMNKL